ncbi:chemotaxis protein CheB [Mycolicibacterium goodii]|uniref:protein-glutamate methylesterase n=1 Tax=Mycolicibacterium goodii TaxID=134601 RepID=A0ABS6HVA2_MYCGD|nr:chemotaxis protein CheB [Mycolicibacterium goodii]MBU8825594.1 chemotaxis protein CheB [Mycolicibacterium goodii]MBU8836367.1 chemotaxis protein CheB [Mycolicibacterium goodii]OKH65038.1 protein-glutamate methylesterase [Mycobacterium sp. SWH-M5]PJK19856.1 chemotaxis protein CheB [Mycolicibacterium goodii]
MTGFDSKHGVVAVGASAGGVEALTRLTANLSRDLSYAILVVLHMPANAPSVLARILDRAGPLPAVTAVDGALLEPGTIYVARPGRHLMVHDSRAVLSEGPTENGHRPAVNALFRSVALAYGPHTIGILLSGVLDDGVLGAAAIKRRGGVVIAQSPTDALFPAMPTNAVQAGVVDHVADAADMGGLIKQLTERTIEERDMEPDESMELENKIAMAERFSTDFDSEALGPPSGYICPDCNGSLSAVSDGNFRCRVGHAWSADALLRARDEEVEGALWVALRSLEEKAKLSRTLAERTGKGVMARRYLELAAEAEHAVSVLSERLAEVSRHTEDDDA